MKENKYKLPLAQRLYHRKYMRQWRKDHPERAKEHYRTYWKRKRGYYLTSEKKKPKEMDKISKR